MDEISFRLLQRDGLINHTATSARFKLMFYDYDSGVFLQKQSPTWDGGWRWFRSELQDAITIYNTRNPACFYDLTDEEIMDTLLDHELLFEIAKIHVNIDINVQTISRGLEDSFRAQARRAWAELFPGVSRTRTVGQVLRNY